MGTGRALLASGVMAVVVLAVSGAVGGEAGARLLARVVAGVTAGVSLYLIAMRALGATELTSLVRIGRATR